MALWVEAYAEAFTYYRMSYPSCFIAPLIVIQRILYVLTEATRRNCSRMFSYLLRIGLIDISV